MTPREALNTSACMMLAVSIIGPWGIPIGYSLGEVVNRALKKRSGPPTGGGTRVMVRRPVENLPDLKIVGGSR
jgi:hypothetical protein